MTREIAISLQEAEARHQRLHSEIGFLTEALERCPAGLCAEFETMLARRKKAADIILERMPAVTIQLPPEG